MNVNDGLKTEYVTVFNVAIFSQDHRGINAFNVNGLSTTLGVEPFFTLLAKPRIGRFGRLPALPYHPVRSKAYIIPLFIEFVSRFNAVKTSCRWYYPITTLIIFLSKPLQVLNNFPSNLKSIQLMFRYSFPCNWNIHLSTIPHSFQGIRTDMRYRIQNRFELIPYIFHIYFLNYFRCHLIHKRNLPFDYSFLLLIIPCPHTVQLSMLLSFSRPQITHLTVSPCLFGNLQT